jgi:hypothetical protein
MEAPQKGVPRRFVGRRLAVWSALAVGWIMPSAGCQVEYAGMTLPSGKYMHDDVQYFPPGPSFPWANTQAATQRARMQAMGIETGPITGGPVVAPTPPGALPAVQGRMGRFGDMNQPLGVVPPLDAQGRPMPAVPAPEVPAGPPAAVPAPAEGTAPGTPPAVPAPGGVAPMP